MIIHVQVRMLHLARRNRYLRHQLSLHRSVIAAFRFLIILSVQVLIYFCYIFFRLFVIVLVIIIIIRILSTDNYSLKW